MKKVVSVVMLIVIIFCTGCAARKEAITESEFISIVEQAGYTTLEVTSGYEDSQLVKKSIAAVKDGIQIELIIATSNSAGENIYNQTKTRDEQNGASTNTSSSIGKKSDYSITTSSTYYFCSRIGDTVVYANEPKENKEAVQQIVEELGY